MKFLVLSAALIIFAIGRGCDSQSKLPDQMPDDLNVVLVERAADTQRISYRIDASTIEVGRGGGWHNRSVTKTTIPRRVAEELYASILQNCFDRIENYSSSDPSSIETDRSITVSFGKKSITVYDGLLHLADEDRKRFEVIRHAVLDIAKSEKGPERE